jgi:tRNA(fMet)-specific endonuclease VapC
MTLRYLLDTNICIYIAKKSPLAVLNKFQQLIVGEVGMSTITYGELIFGAQKSAHPKKTLKLLDELTSLIPALPIATEAGKHYGEIRQYLSKHGKMIGNNDLWIAAHALALNVTVVTNNTKEFKRIPHLKLENWLEDGI